MFLNAPGVASLAEASALFDVVERSTVISSEGVSADIGALATSGSFCKRRVTKVSGLYVTVEWLSVRLRELYR